MPITKTEVRDAALDAGADYVGFADAGDYESPQSPDLSSIFPGVQSLVVMAFRELSSCASPNMRVAMSGRLDLMDFTRSCTYQVARTLEKEGATVMAVPVSYPLEMGMETKGVIGDVSLRHAAVAAGLGDVGRTNLVLHSGLGRRAVVPAVGPARASVQVRRRARARGGAVMAGRVRVVERTLMKGNEAFADGGSKA